MSKVDTAPTGSHKAQSILAVLRSFIDLSGADYDLSVCEEAGVATAEIRDSLQRGHFAVLPRLLPCRSDIVPRFGKVWVTASTCAAGKCNVSGRFFRANASWQFDAETYSLGRTGRHSFEVHWILPEHNRYGDCAATPAESRRSLPFSLHRR